MLWMLQLPRWVATPVSDTNERSILASILLDPSAFFRVADRLVAADFEGYDYQLVWAAVEELARHGSPIDSTTVTSQLEANGCKTPVSTVAEILDALPDPANIESYAETLRSRATGRALKGLSSWLSVSDLPPADLMAELESRLLAIAQRTGGGDAEHISLPLGRAISRLESVANHGASDLTSGLLDLDAMISSFEPSDLVVIAAQPGTGKTALATNILAHLCGQKKKRALFFSLEMSSEQISLRLVAREEKVKFQFIRRPRKDDPFFWTHVIAAQDKISAWPLVIDDTSSLSVLEMMARCRREKMARGLDLVVVDFIQLASGRGDNRAQVVGGIARDLKNMAKTLGLPVIALSQLSRDNAKAKRLPTLFDLKESGDIEAAADVVIILHELDANPVAKTILAIIAKQRNGPTGDRKILFFPEILRFENCAREEV